MSIGQLASGVRKREPIDAARSSRVLIARFGASALHYYHAGNNIEIGGSLYLPLLRADTPSGTLFVSSAGEIFAPDTFVRFGHDPARESSDLARKYPGRRWVVSRDGVSLLTRRGTID